MPFRWNDTTERMMLIKFLEQNPMTKFDVDVALDSWPGGMEAPTKRSLGDRFRFIKQRLREEDPDFTCRELEPKTPQSIPKTPRAKITPKLNHSINTTPSNKKTKLNTSSTIPTSTPNPISKTKGSCSASFKSRLLGWNTSTTKSTPTRGKRKHSPDSTSDEDDDENDDGASSSANEQDSDSEVRASSSGNESDDNSPSSSACTSSSRRRSQPLRRSSVTLTPGSYKAKQGSETEGESAADESGDSVQVMSYETNHSDSKKSSAATSSRTSSAKELKGSDTSEDASAHRETNQHVTQYREANDCERIEPMMIDVDDMQD